MKFNFSDEQVEFRTALRRFLSDTSPTVEVRRLMETDVGYDVDVWRQMSQDLGLTAIHIPESYGGQGFGVSELAIAMEEMGRALLCAPYFASTVLGATAIMKAGLEDQKQTLLPSIAAGEVIATLAFAEEHGRWEADAVAMPATQESDKYILGSGADIAVLEQAGISRTSTVIVTTHDDDLNVFLVIYCRRLRPDVQILSRASKIRSTALESSRIRSTA